MKNESLSGKSRAIEVYKFTKRFRDLVAVDNISFTVNKGEIVGLLGPNGAGKTTTIRMITGVYSLNKIASLKIFNYKINPSNRSYKNYFGIVPEVSNAYRDYSVWQNIRFNARIYGLDKRLIKQRGKELLKTFKLENKINQKTKGLSKGLKQRLNFCMALIHDPPILIFDEPTSGLDPISVKILRNQIQALKRVGKTIFLTTHDMAEAQRVCDRILIMNKGRIIADEHPDILREKVEPYLNILIKFQPNLSTSQLNILRDRLPFNKQEDDFFSISSKKPLRDISNLYDIVTEEDLNVEKLKFKEGTLEEAFIHLIKEDDVK
ncbi:MAG: ATP-binding cassette domain-containing protein [Candidatus Lokiarchaeota archaeon]|nr:ATP-binding cassette domain-containing protein [Candidatus Lokiarchaeota archaeon]